MSVPWVCAWNDGTSCVSAWLRFGWPTFSSAASLSSWIGAALSAAAVPVRKEYRLAGQDWYYRGAVVSAEVSAVVSWACAAVERAVVANSAIVSVLEIRGMDAPI